MATNAALEKAESWSRPHIALRDLRNALAPVEARWRQLGVQFGFTEDELDAIRDGHPGEGVSQWLNSMLNTKLNNCPEFYWEHVVTALEAIGQRRQAEHVRQTFCPQLTDSAAELTPGMLELMDENVARLKDEFADLLVQVSTHLDTTVEPDSLRMYVKAVFVPADFISDKDSVRKMFTSLTDHNRWNYLQYRSLLRLVTRFDRVSVLRERCKEYERSVSHFKFTTRLRDWMHKGNFVAEIAVHPLKLDPEEYSKLSIKVHVKVTSQTLDYVIGLWEDLAETVFQLPDLAAILCDMKEGCLLVSWLIPCSPELKATIRNKARCCSSFFVLHGVQFCTLDNEYLYFSHHGLIQGVHEGATFQRQDVKETTPLLSPTEQPQRKGGFPRLALAKAMTVSINRDLEESDTAPQGCSCCCTIL